MLVVELTLTRESDRPGLPYITAGTVVAETMGAALDAWAPDPAHGAVITVKILHEDVTVVTGKREGW